MNLEEALANAVLLGKLDCNLKINTFIDWVGSRNAGRGKNHYDHHTCRKPDSASCEQLQNKQQAKLGVASLQWGSRTGLEFRRRHIEENKKQKNTIVRSWEVPGIGFDL